MIDNADLCAPGVASILQQQAAGQGAEWVGRAILATCVLAEEASGAGLSPQAAHSVPIHAFEKAKLLTGQSRILLQPGGSGVQPDPRTRSLAWHNSSMHVASCLKGSLSHHPGTEC